MKPPRTRKNENEERKRKRPQRRRKKSGPQEEKKRKYISVPERKQNHQNCGRFAPRSWAKRTMESPTAPRQHHLPHNNHNISHNTGHGCAPSYVIVFLIFNFFKKKIKAR